MLNVHDYLQERYSIVKLLAEGGMSYVYLAQDMKLQQRYVVLKQLKPVFTAYNQLMEKEAEALIKLKHSYLPQLYDLFWHEQSYIVVMEYIEGKMLDEIILLSEASKISVLYQLAQVMLYLHERPVPMVHGDLKPQNIMLDGHHTIKLLDFATSGYIIQTNSQTSSSTQAAMFATRNYAAPERLNGAPSSLQSDLYSFGVVILSLWQREGYFMHHSYSSVEQFCLKELKSLPKPIQHLLSYILQPNPSHRKFTFKTVVALLEGVMGQYDFNLIEEDAILTPKRIAVLNFNRCAGATTIAVAFAKHLATTYTEVSVVELGHRYSNMMMSHIGTYPKHISVIPQYEMISNHNIDYHFQTHYASLNGESSEQCPLEKVYEKLQNEIIIIDFSSIDQRFEWIKEYSSINTIVIVSTDDVFLLNDVEALMVLKTLAGLQEMEIIHIHNHSVTAMKQSFLAEYINLSQFISIPYFSDKKKRVEAYERKWLHPNSGLFKHIKHYVAKISLH